MPSLRHHRLTTNAATLALSATLAATVPTATAVPMYTVTDLGTLGGNNSQALAINASGQIVGSSTITLGSSFQHSFLHTGGTMYDLGTLLQPGSGVTNVGVADINDLGQIAATGIVNGQSHALRLDPVAAPEPTATAMVGLGLLGLGLGRRRRGACFRRLRS